MFGDDEEEGAASRRSQADATYRAQLAAYQRELAAYEARQERLAEEHQKKLESEKDKRYFIAATIAASAGIIGSIMLAHKPSR